MVTFASAQLGHYYPRDDLASDEWRQDDKEVNRSDLENTANLKRQTNCNKRMQMRLQWNVTVWLQVLFAMSIKALVIPHPAKCSLHCHTPWGPKPAFIQPDRIMNLIWRLYHVESNDSQLLT